MKKHIQSWYYYQELKELSIVALVSCGVLGAYNYGNEILKFIFTETGLMLAAFLFISIIIALAIKIHFRIIIIKYYEKDINIELFKHLNDNHKHS